MNVTIPALRTVEVVRYITPLKEGGSLPAIVEADDGFLYVLKFRGAGQGTKALIAEFIGGVVAKELGLKVPELVLCKLCPEFGRTEPDEEIQDLLKASVGLNLGLHYLSGALTFDPAVNKVDALLASKVVWLDSFLMNVDRTARNTNMLIWNKELWLIDHGAALYFHHAWSQLDEQSTRPFVQVKDHVLLPWASEIEEADKLFKSLLKAEAIASMVNEIPDDWLHTGEGTVEEKRKVYLDFLINRLNSSGIFVKQAIHAREALI